MGIFSSVAKFAGTALGGMAGGFAGDIFSASMARKAAGRQMGFQRDMSNTAHQREVRDLRLAGLNPILSATGGPGASSPGGAMAKVPDFASTALGARRLSQEIRNLEATERKTDAETKFTNLKADISSPLADLLRLLSGEGTAPATSTARDIINKVKNIPIRTNKARIQEEDTKPTKRVKAFKYKDTSKNYTRRTHGYSR